MNIGPSLIATLLRRNGQMTYSAFPWTEKDLAKRTMRGPPTVLELSNKTDSLCCYGASRAEVSRDRGRSDNGRFWLPAIVWLNATLGSSSMTLLTSTRCNSFSPFCGVMDIWVAERSMFL